MFLFGGYEFPQLMTINLGQLTTADPHFDSAGFLSFAQGAYWKIHQAAAAGDPEPVRNMLSDAMLMQLQSSMATPIWQTPVQAIQQASIMNVAHDASYDTVTVRIGATSTAKKKSSIVEDWTFRRVSTNTAVAAAAPAPIPTQCPGCGAPISVDERGACRYCGVPIAGVVGDWRLVSTIVPKVAKTASSSGSSGWRAYIVFIILMTVVLPLAITGFVFWQVGKSTDSLTSGFDSGFGFNSPSTTSKPRSLANPTGQPTMDGSLTLTGGLQGTMEPSNLSTTGGEVGVCSARVANVSGVSFLSNVANSDAGLNQQIIVNVTLPAGSKGPGTYPSADVKVVLHETAMTGATGTTPEDNSWTSGEGSTASATVNADDSGTITFANLVTTDPQWAKLNGTLSFTCR